MKAELIDHMGSDDSIVNAARISMDKSADNYTKEQNEGLIRYLATGLRTSDRTALLERMVAVEGFDEAKALLHRIKNTATHWTPFAHTSITLRMQAPVPIRTQCFKQKQGLVENEESRRYISSRPEVYIPPYFSSRPEDVKQGAGDIHAQNTYLMTTYKDHTRLAVDMYMHWVDALKVAPEQARFLLPQGCEVNWFWTGNLYAFANFYNKRTDAHAQAEIRELAREVGDIIAPLFPVSWKALTSEDF